MVSRSNGKIKIIAAGRIYKKDISELVQLIHTEEFHGKKIVGDLN